MESNYYSNYFKSIYAGLNNSKYFIHKNEINANAFFEEIKKKLNEIRQKKINYIFLVMGQVLLLLIIWH